jgi:hypothetical protein
MAATTTNTLAVNSAILVAATAGPTNNSLSLIQRNEVHETLFEALKDDAGKQGRMQQRIQW